MDYLPLCGLPLFVKFISHAFLLVIILFGLPPFSNNKMKTYLFLFRTFLMYYYLLVLLLIVLLLLLLCVKEMKVFILNIEK